jgi:hypothetical protein
MTDFFGRGAVNGRRMIGFIRGAAVLGALAVLAAACIGGEANAATPGKATLVLKRVSAILYVGAPASVKVNGKSVASVASGGTETVEIAPGKSAVSVETWSYPGTWTVNINAKAGQTYTLEISPRGASYGPSLLGPLGAAIESNGGKNKNTGAFEIKLKGR